MSSLNSETQQGELSKSEKDIRDRFVAEYMKDNDAVQAAVRIGFIHVFALDWGPRFMLETYTLNKIETAKRAIVEKNVSKQTIEEDKAEIISALRREMNYMGPGSSQAARVAAASKLASLRDMDPIKKVDKTLNMRERGGVMRVPGIANVQEWEDAAIASQTALLKDVQLH